MKHALAQTYRRLKDCARGAASIEFAWSVPVLATLFMGGMEVSRFILVNQKVDKVVYTVADLIGQENNASFSSVNQIFLAAREIMQPYTFNTNGVVIVSSVSRPDANTPPRVNWQRRGGGTMDRASMIGTPGQSAALPVGFSMNAKDNIIIAEVFYTYSPLLSSRLMGDNSNVYKRAIYKPRLGALETISPN